MFRSDSVMLKRVSGVFKQAWTLQAGQVVDRVIRIGVPNRIYPLKPARNSKKLQD